MPLSLRRFAQSHSNAASARPIVLQRCRAAFVESACACRQHDGQKPENILSDRPGSGLSSTRAAARTGCKRLSTEACCGPPRSRVQRGRTKDRAACGPERPHRWGVGSAGASFRPRVERRTGRPVGHAPRPRLLRAAKSRRPPLRDDGAAGASLRGVGRSVDRHGEPYEPRAALHGVEQQRRVFRNSLNFG